MLTAAARETAVAKWLAHWRGWESAGVSMAEYARREGFEADAAYRWKRILRRTGQWIEAQGAPAVRGKKRVLPARFARVSVSDTPVVSMVIRLVLMNGRRAELEIGGVTQLEQVIDALERAL